MDKETLLSFVPANVHLSSDAQEKLWRAFGAFEEVSKILNLTGLKTPEDRAQKLFADSLAPLAFFDFKNVQTLGDIGTGGGFPGVPLACALPHIQFTLIDATRKKIDAVEKIVHAVGLTNVKTKWARSETLVKEKVSFDVVTTKAVAHFVPMLALSLPLVRTGGHLLAYAGPDEAIHTPEVGNSTKKFRAKFQEAYRYQLANESRERQIVVYRKGN